MAGSGVLKSLFRALQTLLGVLQFSRSKSPSARMCAPARGGYCRRLAGDLGKRAAVSASCCSGTDWCRMHLTCDGCEEVAGIRMLRDAPLVEVRPPTAVAWACVMRCFRNGQSRAGWCALQGACSLSQSTQMAGACGLPLLRLRHCPDPAASPGNSFFATAACCYND